MTPPRPNYAGTILHVYNRRVDRQTLFFNSHDYLSFQLLLQRATERANIELLQWCLMPNHWHMALIPRGPKDLPRFMHWLQGTHAKRWCTFNDTLGEGPVYQRPYHVTPVQHGTHLDTLIAYIAQNPVRAGLCQHPSDWNWQGGRWSSKPSDHDSHRTTVDGSFTLLDRLGDETVQELDQHLSDLTPIGGPDWSWESARRLDLTRHFRGRGRPDDPHFGSSPSPN